MRSRLIKALNNRFYLKFMQLEIGLLCKCPSGKKSWRQRKVQNALVHHTIILDSATNSAYGTISKDMSIIYDYDSII